jgi:pimeloyl-ACP methyl ester carboxylesterase
MFANADAFANHCAGVLVALIATRCGKNQNIIGEGMSKEVRNVVLVHGAWADGSSWGDVITRLSARGMNIIAAPLPLTSLADDVQALERTLARIEGNAVVAGHAYAGAVIGETRSDKVSALVYVAALAPDEGETVADVFGRGEAHPKAPALSPDADGFMWLPKAAFADAFAQNATSQTLDMLPAVQRPISVACITAPVGRPRWKDVPTWYLVAEQDRMIVKEKQEFMSSRMNATVVSQPVDHVPSLTAPELVVDIIMEAAACVK